MSFELYANLAAIVVNLLVGGRLLWRGFRNRERPELLLGSAFALDGIEWLLWVLSAHPPAAGSPLGDWLGVGCRLGIVGHNLCLLAFTRLVFRPESRMALTAVAVVAFVMVSSLVVGVAQGDWLGYRSDRVWIWLESGSQLIAYGWALVESTAYYAPMRRRLALGLADPVVANRVLLWAIYAGCMLGASLAYLISIGVATPAGEYPFALDAWMIGFTALSGAAIWLAFYPPDAYRRRLSSAGQSPAL